MSIVRGLILVACLMASIAAAERFGKSQWFVLVAVVTTMGAWFVGMLDEAARAERAATRPRAATRRGDSA